MYNQGIKLKQYMRDETMKKSMSVDKKTLCTLSTDTAGKLDVFGHNGDTLGVDGAQVGVLKQSHKVCLTGLLESTNGSTLEAKIGLEVLGNFSDQALEGQLADQQLSRLLVSPDLTKGDSTGPVSVGLLDTPCGRCALPGSLGGQLLARSLSSSRLSGCLLGTCHSERILSVITITLMGSSLVASLPQISE